MFEAYARWIVLRPVAWTVVLLTLVVALVSGALALTVEQDDDVLAFLPETNPEIRAFREINERFGSTDIALVGISTPDPFDPGFVAELQALVKDLREVEGLDATLTATNVQDFTADPEGGGIITSELIPAPPADEAAAAALRTKVMSRDHIVGTLISEDADAVLLLAFAAPHQEPRAIAERVRGAVLQHFEEDQIAWGGGPFISSYIFETTQADMARLTPWAALAIVLLMYLAFRDLLGTLLGLVATGLGISVARALMHVLEIKFNIVLSSMPILLFAVGSAYAIHMLSHIDQHARMVGRTPEAVTRAIIGTGPPLVVAGLTTVAGLLSFVTMDIEPMRTFGTFTALGVAVALVASLTFIPALLSLFPRPVRTSAPGLPVRVAMMGLARQVREHRRSALVGVALITLFGLYFAGNVRSRMELSAFFHDGSPPDVGQRFLDREFGGSQFVQLLVQGDLEEPEVLRELGRIGDRIALVPHVTAVQGIEGVVAIINDAMTGARRIPDTRGQVSFLYRFLTSDPAVSRLVTDDRSQALLQIKVGSSKADDLDAVLAEVERIVREEAITRYRVVPVSKAPEVALARQRDVLIARVQALAVAYKVALPADAPATITAFLAQPAPPASASVVAAGLATFLRSGENWATVAEDRVDATAVALAEAGREASEEALGLAAAAVMGVPADDAAVSDLLMSADQQRQDLWRRASAKAAAEALVSALGLAAPADAKGERFVAAIASKLQDRTLPDTLVASTEEADPKLVWTVSGMPALYRGLSHSVTANQFASLGSSLALVLIILTLYYRSLYVGVLAAMPTLFTLASVYGIMGFMGMQLDIGTSMLASLVIGAGVDYGVHMLAAWKATEDEGVLAAAQHAVDETSHGIWTNALVVASGFFVLTLGESRPLQNVGALTATAMIVAALATFGLMPLFASRTRYGRTS